MRSFGEWHSIPAGLGKGGSNFLLPGAPPFVCLLQAQQKREWEIGLGGSKTFKLDIGK